MAHLSNAPEGMSMARKKTRGVSPISTTEEESMVNAASGPDSISGYWRTILEANPHLLRQRSNEELYEMYLKEYGGTEVPKSAQQGLSNVKSILRKKKKLGKRKATVAAAKGDGNGTTSHRPARLTTKALEALEDHIDEAMSMARTLDRDGLEPVIQALKKARYEVILKMGS
jgi:hypothetical protein